MTPSSLMYIYNDLGFTDLELSGRYKSGGWSKWVKFEKLMENKYTDWDFYTDRTIADIEVILDYDFFICPKCREYVHTSKCRKCKAEVNHVERIMWIQLYVNGIRERLLQDGLRFRDYFSGSKGRHISMIFPDLRKMHEYKRKLWKQRFISKYNGEGLKASKRVMILREEANNPKTGGRKMLLFEKPGYNQVEV